MIPIFKSTYLSILLMCLIEKILADNPHSLDPTCSSNCTPLVRIPQPEKPQISISTSETNVLIVSAPRTIPGLRYKVNRYFEVCPWGFGYATNKRCTMHLASMPPNRNLFSEMYSERKCYVGSDCHPNSDECDHDGIIHCTPDPIYKRKISPQFFSFDRLHRRNIMTSSCVQDWECHSDLINVPIYLDHSEISGLVPFTYSLDGSYFRLSFKEWSHYTDASNYSLIVPPILIQRDVNAKAKCLSSRNRTFCISTKSIIAPEGTVFKLNDGCFGTVNNLLLVRRCNMSSEVAEESIKEMGSDSTLRQLTEVMNMVLFSQLQDQLNTLELLRTISEIQSLISEFVKSSSKTNPRLIGDLLGMPSHTIWISPHNFTLCPCPAFKYDGGCTNQWKWSSTTHTERTINDSCYPSIYLKKGEPISLTFFNKTDLFLELMASISFVPSASSQASKFSREGEESKSFVPGNDNSWMLLLNMVWDKVSSIFMLLGALFGWISFSGYFCSCIRRPV